MVRLLKITLIINDRVIQLIMMIMMMILKMKIIKKKLISILKLRKVPIIFLNAMKVFVKNINFIKKINHQILEHLMGD